jgi:3-oxoadipate enol-lactonase
MDWLFTPMFMAQRALVEAALTEPEDAAYPEPPVHGVLAQVAAARTHDTLGRLGQIAAETRVLVGAEDILTPVPDAEELARGIPRARLQVLERGGHAAVMEYPEAVAEALLTFLDPRVDDRPPG